MHIKRVRHNNAVNRLIITAKKGVERMNEITMIPVGLLEHHPENPRKDLGDLTELTASIKKNGIMQNLTVIADPETSKYLVVIGNRRLEAAKAAGLIELPCVVKDLDHKTQISTMLEENMQRQDLTVYEQAQGFQMMMDLGYTAKDISEKTGFSEKTVKDRIKFTKFNQKNFEKAVAAGATLLDMIEISKLESKSDQNDVMKEAGTNNFRQALNRKLGDQEFRKNSERLSKIADEEGLELIPENVIVWQYYNNQGTPTGTYESEDKIRKAIKKIVKGNKDTKLFYQIGKSWNDNAARLQVYKQKEEQAKTLTEEEQAQKERDRARQKKLREVKKLWAEAYQLRVDFIRNYTVAAGGGMTTIGKLIIKYALIQQQKWGKQPLVERHDWKEKYIKEALGIEEAEDYEDKRSLWDRIEARTDIPMIRATLAWICGGGVFVADAPEHGLYDYYSGKYSPGAYEAEDMVSMYEFLQEIGYQMSDLEKQLMDGTHECYQGAGA